MTSNRTRFIGQKNSVQDWKKSREEAHIRRINIQNWNPSLNSRCFRSKHFISLNLYLRLRCSLPFLAVEDACQSPPSRGAHPYGFHPRAIEGRKCLWFYIVSYWRFFIICNGDGPIYVEYYSSCFLNSIWNLCCGIASDLWRQSCLN